VTATGITVVGVSSLLKPITAGLKIIVSGPVVIISAITPELIAGSSNLVLKESADLEEESV
jgi:hypothetical protein